MSGNDPGVCLVTQPHRERASKDHAYDLAEIVAEITAVTVVTANLPADSALRADHEVEEYSTGGAGTNVVAEALRFVLNQLRLCRLLLRREEAVVLFFGTTSYLLPAAFARLTGKTVLVLPRGDVPLSLRLRWEESMPAPIARALAGAVSVLERVNYRLADAVVSYTPSMATQLGLGRYEHKLYTSGARFVDTEQFDVHRPYRQRDRTVGFIGRLDVEKQIPKLAAATQRLPEDIRFVFVGDGDYRELLEQELAAEIDRGSVELVGWVDREAVPAQLNRLRLLVVPSHPTEGLPTAIQEGMACGTPAYATPVSGVPDLVREGETGFLMDSTDPDEIAADIEAILDRDDLETVSEEARSLVETEYSFEAAVRRWRGILEDVGGHS
jgi:glycosyltransferase involved in cell wall biosynthesis